MAHPDVYVESHGPETSPALILVHGAPDRSTSFRAVLARHGDRRVIVYDRRGYGRSIEATAARSMRDHADDLLAIAGACPEPPVVVAHSFGANVTMLAASLQPRAFRSLGLWEPPLLWVDWWPERIKTYNVSVAKSDDPAREVDRMNRWILGKEKWLDLPAEVGDLRRAEGVAFQLDMASELEAPCDFADLVVPALVGYGTATTEDHIAGAKWLAGQLPNGELHVVPDAGHFAPRTHPEEYAAFMTAAANLS
ncbi:MAG TPA: alpha/beta hydrolase [Acidimicrobiales bacterium]|nr:alpha/beta hydrolase [Acidimicrobiales bacterium]